MELAVTGALLVPVLFALTHFLDAVEGRRGVTLPDPVACPLPRCEPHLGDVSDHLRGDHCRTCGARAEPAAPPSGLSGVRVMALFRMAAIVPDSTRASSRNHRAEGPVCRILRRGKNAHARSVLLGPHINHIPSFSGDPRQRDAGRLCLRHRACRTLRCAPARPLHRRRLLRPPFFRLRGVLNRARDLQKKGIVVN